MQNPSTPRLFLTGAIAIASVLFVVVSCQPKPVIESGAQPPSNTAKRHDAPMVSYKVAVEKSIESAALLQQATETTELGRLAAELLSTTVKGDWSTYFDTRIANGLVLNRQMAEGLASAYSESGLPVASGKEVSDRELFVRLANAAKQKGTHVSGIEIGSLEWHAGFVTVAGSPEWPFESLVGQTSLFESTVGTWTDQAERGEPNWHRMRLIARTQLDDGSKGAIIACFLYDVQAKAWRIRSFAVYSAASANWPVPICCNQRSKYAQFI